MTTYRSKTPHYDFTRSKHYIERSSKVQRYIDVLMAKDQYEEGYELFIPDYKNRHTWIRSCGRALWAWSSTPVHTAKNPYRLGVSKALETLGIGNWREYGNTTTYVNSLSEEETLWLLNLGASLKISLMARGLLRELVSQPSMGSEREKYYRLAFMELRKRHTFLSQQQKTCCLENLVPKKLLSSIQRVEES